MITFFAQGDPKGQPRPKAFSRGGHARVYDPGTAEAWKGQIALAAQTHRPLEPLLGPLRVTLGFRFKRPSNHFGTGKNADKLKPTAPQYHTSKPDADNLAKAVFDALTTLGFWRDDAQIAVARVSKLYEAGPTGCFITIEEARI